MSERKENFKIKEYTAQLKDSQIVLIRPLMSSDKDKIVDFLSNLSDKTRQYYILDNYGEKTADSLCESIGKPGKLHFVVENNNSHIVALVKFSLDFPDVDKSRYLNYGIELEPNIVTRCGTCIADQYQNLGLGGVTLQQIIDTSRDLDKKTIVLSGGIFTSNQRAIHMCQKFGFEIVGRFLDLNGQEHVDMFRHV